MKAVKRLHGFLCSHPFFLFSTLLFIAFSFYFLRPGLVGADGYGYMVEICEKTDIIKEFNAFNFVVEWFPCSFLAAKSVLFFLSLVSGYFIIKIATLFSPNNGWRASYLVFASPLFLLEAVKFENDQFAYPIMFASLYLFFKGRRFLALALLVFAGMFWQGAIYYLIGFGLQWLALGLIELALFSIPKTPFTWTTILGNIIRTKTIMEDASFTALKYWFILTVGIIGIFREKKILPMAAFTIIIGVASLKLAPLALPFLVIGMVKLLE